MAKLKKSVLIYSHDEGDTDFFLDYSSGRPQLELPDGLGRKFKEFISNAWDSSFEALGDEELKKLKEAFTEENETLKSGYHLATRNHPFLDMSTGLAARVEDAAIMSGYVEVDGSPSIGLTVNHSYSVPIEDARDLNLDALRNSTKYQFDLVISGTFGVRAKQPKYYDPETGYHQVPLLKKSIPSGGARHPSECFFEVVKSPVLQPGLYYFSPTLSVAQFVDSEFSGSSCFKGLMSSDADWLIFIYICSSVRQAMFRYRDPRSFRAILVDVGHAEGQMAALANFCNWKYRSDLLIDFDLFKPYAEESQEDGLPVISVGVLEGWD